jgi:hypothetical protein
MVKKLGGKDLKIEHIWMNLVANGLKIEQNADD